ncbi:AbrB/MazE/SpoVT family DNA-binding domain-containing protein [Paenibacillus residui]|uniref:AbrB/MazE/SpoVT family DNA-binding domain-containing protein n=1 Tax=Paenibacillus residui TaxID=629724 RepID=A0ABW3D923_9BACL
MKSTGIVRKVDELGRIVIPMELRKSLGISEKDPMEIFVDGDQIILRKYAPGCVFTGDTTDLVSYQGKLVSRRAIQEMSKIK